jgi:hypothetical protein
MSGIGRSIMGGGVGMVLLLAACGGGNSGGNTGAAPQETETPEETACIDRQAGEAAVERATALEPTFNQFEDDPKKAADMLDRRADQLESAAVAFEADPAITDPLLVATEETRAAADALRAGDSQASVEHLQKFQESWQESAAAMKTTTVPDC